MPRAQFVEPSTGSTTTVTSASAGPVRPDSSLTTATSARASTSSTAASTKTSSAYCPGTVVRSRRCAVVSVPIASCCALNASWNSSSSRSAPGAMRSGGDDVDDRVVVRDAGRDVAQPGWEQRIALGPEHLHVAGKQLLHLDPAAELAVVRSHDDRGSVAH